MLKKANKLRFLWEKKKKKRFRGLKIECTYIKIRAQDFFYHLKIKKCYFSYQNLVEIFFQPLTIDYDLCARQVLKLIVL